MVNKVSLVFINSHYSASNWTVYKMKKNRFTNILILFWGCLILMLTLLPVAFIYPLLRVDKGHIVQMIRHIEIFGQFPCIAVSFDKLVHFFLFAVLSFFLVMGFSFNKQRSITKLVPSVFFIGGVSGIGTELMQNFVPTRTFCFQDICANLTGVMFGLMAGVGIAAVIRLIRMTGLSEISIQTS